MFFVTSILHSVENLDNASAFFCDVLGFYLKDKTLDTQIVDNGTISIRLVSTPNDSGSFLQLELQTRELEKTTAELLTLDQVSLLAENIQIDTFRIENHLQCPHHLQLRVYRQFNEDELNITPDLPIALDWYPEVIDCVQQLLKLVPLSFRDSARSRITEHAELLTTKQGSITVTLTIALQAIAKSTPKFQHPSLKSALIERGINPENYFDNADEATAD